jgi:hypothetical protein
LPTDTNRPFPVVGSTIVGPTAGTLYNVDTQNYTMLEFTPLYIGQLKTLDVDYKYNHGLKHTKKVGGAVETFAFDVFVGSSPSTGLSKTQQTAELNVATPSKIVDLRVAGGFSSYAPATLLESLPKNVSNVLGLTMNYWSPSDNVFFLNFCSKIF